MKNVKGTSCLFDTIQYQLPDGLWELSISLEILSVRISADLQRLTQK